MERKCKINKFPDFKTRGKMQTMKKVLAITILESSGITRNPEGRRGASSEKHSSIGAKTS
jgi:hypothetical protein